MPSGDETTWNKPDFFANPVKQVQPTKDVVKLVEMTGAMGPKPQPLAGRIVTVFNRSEVVGRPLASMLANDDATVGRPLRQGKPASISLRPRC